MFECDVIHILSRQRRQEGSIRFICIPSCVCEGAPPMEKQVRVMQPREEPEVVCWCWTIPWMWCWEAWGWLCVLPLTAAEPGRLPHLSEPRCPHLSPDVHHMPGHFFCRWYVDPFISSLHMLTHAHVHIHVCTCKHSAPQSQAHMCRNTHPWTQVCSSSAIWIMPSWSSTSGPSHLTPIACSSEPQWQSHTRLPSISLSCLGCV